MMPNVGILKYQNAKYHHYKVSLCRMSSIQSVTILNVVITKCHDAKCHHYKMSICRMSSFQIVVMPNVTERV
jgi:hypothetical protein